MAFCCHIQYDHKRSTEFLATILAFSLMCSNDKTIKIIPYATLLGIAFFVRQLCSSFICSCSVRYGFTIIFYRKCEWMTQILKLFTKYRKRNSFEPNPDGKKKGNKKHCFNRHEHYKQRRCLRFLLVKLSIYLIPHFIGFFI